MTVFYILVIVAAWLIILTTFAVRGRKGHPGLKALQGWCYAHRGLHGNGVPENSMAAFRAALDHGYGIELDLHLLKDGNLAVIHDSKLVRTTGAEGCVEDLTTKDLTNYRLENTEETIPLFSQVLELYRGEAPLIVELKATSKNHGALCEAACNMLESYNGPYCLESFDPRCVAWLKKHRSHLIRGQLTENFFKSNSKLPGIVKFVMKYNLLHIATRPDFVAYRFSDRKNISNFLCRKLWKVQGVTWTLRCKEDFDTAVAEGWIPIFENFEP